MKTCTYGNLICPYAKQCGTTIWCVYMGYCDYQLPRDSRKCHIGKWEGKENEKTN
jgi:hypothetical protein